MAFIVADSGSTKTDWRLIDDDGTVSVRHTSGLNPSYYSQEQIREIIREELDADWQQSNIRVLHYYGAGCSGKIRQTKMKEALQSVFNTGKVEVQHDLTGAARACLGTDKGVIAIMGTGSSIGYFDGQSVSSKFQALGYLLGDEGSGNHLGKTLLRKYLRKKLSDDLLSAFHNKYNLTDEELIVKLYSSKAPNQFMASFTTFLDEHKDHDEIRDLIRSCFNDFFEQQFCHYKNHQKVSMGFIGSIAFVFQDFLREVAAKHDVNIRRILRNPIEALVEFHKTI